jgi:hypothetical protein
LQDFVLRLIQIMLLTLETRRYYAIRKAPNLKAPAIFFNNEDFFAQLPKQKDGKTPTTEGVEYKSFHRVTDAIKWLVDYDKNDEEEEPTPTKEIEVPTGSLGLLLVNEAYDANGKAFIAGVKPESALSGQVNPGDRIVAVNGKDTSDMNVRHLTEAISVNAHNQRKPRKFTILCSGRDPKDGPVKLEKVLRPDLHRRANSDKAKEQVASNFDLNKAQFGETVEEFEERLLKMQYEWYSKKQVRMKKP